MTLGSLGDKGASVLAGAGGRPLLLTARRAAEGGRATATAGGILRARQGFCLNPLLRAPKGHHRVTKVGKDLQFT